MMLRFLLLQPFGSGPLRNDDNSHLTARLKFQRELQQQVRIMLHAERTGIEQADVVRDPLLPGPGIVLRTPFGRVASPATAASTAKTYRPVPAGKDPCFQKRPGRRSALPAHPAVSGWRRSRGGIRHGRAWPGNDLIPPGTDDRHSHE